MILTEKPFCFSHISGLHQFVLKYIQALLKAEHSLLKTALGFVLTEETENLACYILL